MKIILYELNELPIGLLENYANYYPDSSIAKILKSSFKFGTHCDDKGELHPWTSWPTFHTGVSSAEHNYFYLNQDKHSNEIYPPIWDKAISKGFIVGVFGALQSKINYSYLEGYKFFIPDTFNEVSKCIPNDLNNFQKLNLYFVSKLRNL